MNIFNKYILSITYMTGSLLGTRGTAMKRKIDINPILR